MPDGYDIDEEDGVLVLTFHRPPALETILAAGDSLSERDGPPRRLWDFSCGMAFRTDELQQIADRAQTRQLPDGSRVALVAVDDLSFGLSRMFKAYRDDARTQANVFRTREEAMRWLRGDD